MSLSVTLYHYENDDIKIDIEARFDGELLVIDGYDSGKRVKEYWGNSDYEYSVSIPPEGVAKLYSIMNIKEGDPSALLKEIATYYNTNTCYSQFRNFLEQHHIPNSGFSWP